MSALPRTVSRVPHLVLALLVAALVALATVVALPAPGHAAVNVATARNAEGHYTLTKAYVRKHPRLIKAVRVALDQRGKKYKYGAEGPKRFDCSGLVQYAYAAAGLKLPRTSGAQREATTRIAKSDLRRGDLMFFYAKKRVYHVGVFLAWKNGRALMVHSPKPGERVRRNVPWTTKWRAGTLRRVR